MAKYILGADVGGTTVKFGLFTADGYLLEKWEIPTDTADGGARILEDIAASCKKKLKQRVIPSGEVLGIGLGVPGPVREDGSVDVCVNLGWGAKRVKDEMEAALGVPAAVANDANAAALGELWQGGGKGYEDAVVVTIGTGVGGGVIVGGKVVSGAHGYGGEIGHLTINPEEETPCNCGKRGCLEQYCSAPGLVRETKKALAAGGGETALSDAASLDAKVIFDAAKAGDAFAVSMVELFAKRLARALSFLACVTDPAIFVLGGGVSGAGEILTKTVEKYYREYTFAGQRDAKFALARLGNDAGIYGCARLILL